MCTIQIDCNNTIIDCILWPDIYEKIENMQECKERNIALNGIVRKDKYRNKKVLYSCDKTKFYIVG